MMVGSVHAEYRAWSNSEGVRIEAEFVKAEGENVTLRLRSGKVTTFAQSKLSEADREFIKENGKETETEAQPSVDPKRKAKWLTKMDKAKEEAAETGLPILVLFTGTSWCPYCIKLEDAVFSEKEFETFANQHLVLLKLDFGPGGSAESRKDEDLKKEFKVTGFPSYFLTDASGSTLPKNGYYDGINPAKFAEWVGRNGVRK